MIVHANTVAVNIERTYPMAPTIAPAARDRLAQIDEVTFLERIAIVQMFVAPYGRPVGTHQIGRMLKLGFDPRKLGIITVSMREDGRFAIIDGNHRRQLAAHAGLTELLARVFIDLTYEEEADLYIALNTIKPPTALDRWRARVEMREALPLHVNEILARHDLRVAQHQTTSTPGLVQCVRSLEKAYVERGPQAFEELFVILRRAWGTDPSAYSGRMIDGLSAFWARYRDLADLDRLVIQLQQTTPLRLAAAAGIVVMANGSRDEALGKQIVMAYVGRSRSKFSLPDWRPRILHADSTATEWDGKRVVGTAPKTRRFALRKRPQVDR